jgi:two-component system response regulator PrrA
VREAEDGLSALDEVTAYLPAGVVIDAAAPGLDGVTVVRRIRGLGLGLLGPGRTLPVCVTAASGRRHADALAAGADDFTIKPVAPGDIAARLQALVRVNNREPGQQLIAGDLVIDPTRREACRRGRDLELTVREFDLLRVFAAHCGRVLGRTELLEQVWGYTWEVDDRVVDVFVAALRAKLEAAGEPRVLSSVRNDGFVLNP